MRLILKWGRSERTGPVMSDTGFIVTVDCTKIFHSVSLITMETHVEAKKFAEEHLKKEGVFDFIFYSFLGCNYMYVCSLSKEEVCSLLLKGFDVVDIK